MSQAPQTNCPHCGARLEKLALPEVVFDHAWDLVCFNDQCPYFVRGWSWMESEYCVTASYRYRIDPGSGRASPLAVWSRTAYLSRVLRDGTPGAAGEKEHP